MSTQSKLARTLSGKSRLLAEFAGVAVFLMLPFQTVALGQTAASTRQMQTNDSHAAAVAEPASAQPANYDDRSNAHLLKTSRANPASAEKANVSMVEPAASIAARPNQPGRTWQGTVSTLGFWSAQAAMWSAVFLDGTVSGSGTNCVESNSWFSDANGNFQRGQYYKVNVPISAAATVLGVYLNHKAGNSRHGTLLRLLAVTPASGLAIAHTHAALGWIHNCH